MVTHKLPLQKRVVSDQMLGIACKISSLHHRHFREILERDFLDHFSHAQGKFAQLPIQIEHLIVRRIQIL